MVVNVQVKQLIHKILLESTKKLILYPTGAKLK